MIKFLWIFPLENTLHNLRFMAIFKLHWVTKAHIEYNVFLKFSLVFMAIIVFGSPPHASE